MSKRATIPTPAPQLDHRSEQQPYRRDMEAIYADTRIVKRLSATQPGALKLARRYGDALVCVRYRHDSDHRHRYTTVELVVDEAPVQNRARLDEIVMVHLAFDDTRRRQLALAEAPGGTPVVGYGPCHDESPRSFVCRPESSKTEANNVARNICSPRHILATCKKHRTSRTKAMAAYGNSKWQLFATVGALRLAAGIRIDV